MIYILETENPDAVAEHEGSLALALRALSEFTGEPESTDMIEEAISLYRHSIPKLIDNSCVTDLVYARINFSAALLSAADRSGGNRAIELHYTALQEIESVLDVIDPIELPMIWAFATSNKAMILRSVSDYLPNRDAMESVESSIRLYLSILSIYNDRKTPREWIRVNSNLAGAHYTLAHLNEEVAVRELLAAESILRKILNTTSAVESSAARATAMNTLGLVLRELSLKIEPNQAIDILKESIDSHLYALNLRSADNEPIEWIHTSANLAMSEYFWGLFKNDESIKNRAINRIKSVINISHSKGYVSMVSQSEAMLNNILQMKI